MGGFSKDYELTGPVGSDLASDIDTMIKDGSKSATAERIALEHVPLDSSATGANDKNNPNAQGRHIPGMVSVLLSGTTAEIAQFVSDNQPPTGTGIGTGAIALDTTLGQLQRFDGTTFVNLGLDATIYTAGDGILLVGSEIAIDPATDDDMIAGTSNAKVVTPLSAKWGFGLTEYMELKQIQNSGVAETVEASPFERKYPTVVENTITGASLPTDYQISLPVGTYLIDISCPIVFTSAVNTGFQLFLYNETDVTVQLDVGGNQMLSPSTFNTSAHNNGMDCRLRGTFTLSAASILSVRGNDASKGYTTSGTYKNQYGSVQLWKKKFVNP